MKDFMPTCSHLKLSGSTLTLTLMLDTLSWPSRNLRGQFPADLRSLAFTPTRIPPARPPYPPATTFVPASMSTSALHVLRSLRCDASTMEESRSG